MYVMHDKADIAHGLNVPAHARKLISSDLRSSIASLLNQHFTVFCFSYLIQQNSIPLSCPSPRRTDLVLPVDQSRSRLQGLKPLIRHWVIYDPLLKGLVEPRFQRRFGKFFRVRGRCFGVKRKGVHYVGVVAWPYGRRLHVYIHIPRMTARARHVRQQPRYPYRCELWIQACGSKATKSIL